MANVKAGGGPSAAQTRRGRRRPGSNQPAHQERRSSAAAGEQPAVSPWEWVVALVGLAVVAGAIGYLLWHELTVPDTPPLLRLEAKSVEPAGDDRWVVAFTAINGGTSTVAGLTIEGELRDGQSTVETSEATIDYVPANSEREGGLFFTRDPAQYRLELRPKGYQSP